MTPNTPPALRLAPDAAIDLHLHTTYSDGHWRPTDLFDHLAQGDFALVSVVDHDQLSHLPETQALGATRGVAVIPATEVTADWRGVGAHLLCYAPLTTGFTSDALAGLLARTREAMANNTRMLYAAMLARGYTFPRQAELLADQGGQVIRAGDIADLLTGHGYIPGRREALHMVTAAGYQQARAGLAEAVAAAHASGALCALAHPGRGEGEIHRYSVEEIETLLADAPLDGIEALYPTHTAEQVAEFTALAARRGLLISAGSDSHGPRQRLPIPYAAAQVAPLLARLGVAVEG